MGAYLLLVLDYLSDFSKLIGTRLIEKIDQLILLFLLEQDITSEHPERFFIAEIVREKIFMQFRNEVPYACQVNLHLLN